MPAITVTLDGTTATTVVTTPLPKDTMPSLGLNGNHLTWAGPQTLFSNLGIAYTRLEASESDPNATRTLLDGAATCATIGQVPVIALEPTGYDLGMALPAGSAITNYAAWFVTQIQAIETAHPTLGGLYEIVNEPWEFFANATAAGYADLAIQVLTACQAAKLDMTRIYAAVLNPAWAAGVYAQQPGLKTLAQGWSVHPYGPPPPSYLSAANQGIACLPNLREHLFSGANNLLVSEIGVWTPDVNGGASGSPSQPGAALNVTEAAQWVFEIARAARRYHDEGWLRATLFYHRADGGWSMINAADGSLTAMGQALIAAAVWPDAVPR